MWCLRGQGFPVQGCSQEQASKREPATLAHVQDQQLPTSWALPMKCHPFYKTHAWEVARKQCLHDSGWLCARCNTSLVGMGRKAHVHHRKPYRKAPALGTEPLNLLALCQPCHNAEEHGPKGSCDADGMPIDASHPWFAKTKRKT